MNFDGDVNYSSFSNEELLEAYDGINPSKYPVNFKNLSAEMTVRSMFENGSINEMSRGSGAGPTRKRFIAALAIILSMGSVFSYHITRFPDGPIEPCGTNQYCGKQGQPHTFDEFRAFKFWDTTLFYLWPGGMLTLFILLRPRRV